MTKTKLFAAAAIMTSLMATPVLAQTMQRETSQNTSQLKKQQMKKSSVRSVSRGYRASTGYDDRMGFNDGYNRSNTGFFPVDAAAGIVGGAVNTAGGIASAPIQSNWENGYASNDGYGYNGGYVANRSYRDSYAQVGAFGTAPYTNPYENNRSTWNDGWNNGWSGPGYAQRNAFACEPGTVFINGYGIRTLCQ